MPNNVETLMEMGFSRNRAEKALHKINYKGVEAAMECEDPDIDDPFEAPKGHVLSDTVEAIEEPEGCVTEESKEIEQIVKSLKCEDCGKLLRSETDVQAHAARTQHSNFSECTEEIKPLSAEERKSQLGKLQERLKQKRVEKDEQDKKEALKKEISRRKSGKEIVSIKQQMQELEVKKIAEERKRQKLEDKLARQKVIEQIEKDKAERAAKFGKGSSVDSPSNTSSPLVPLTAVDPMQKKEYDQTRLQIRLTNGHALTQSFGVKEPLAAVRLYVELNRTDGSGDFCLMMTFPRKVFTQEDLEKPLSELECFVIVRAGSQGH